MGLCIKHHDGRWFQYERASRLYRPLFLYRAFIRNKKGLVMDPAFKSLGHELLAFSRRVPCYTGNSQYSSHHMGTFKYDLA